MMHIHIGKYALVAAGTLYLLLSFVHWFRVTRKINKEVKRLTDDIFNPKGKQ